MMHISGYPSGDVWYLDRAQEESQDRGPGFGRWGLRMVQPES